MALLRVVFGLKVETFWNKQVADRILYYVKEVSFHFRSSAGWRAAAGSNKLALNEYSLIQ
jgi:hypothetical protein